MEKGVALALTLTQRKAGLMSLPADGLPVSDAALCLLAASRWPYATSAPDPTPATSTAKGCSLVDFSCTSVTLL